MGVHRDRSEAPVDTERSVLDRAAKKLYAQGRTSTPEDRLRARNDLVVLAAPYACRLARRFSGRGEPREDLEQVAQLAVVIAADRYDPDRGSFTAYAAITITGEIKRHFRDAAWGVHVPRRMRDLRNGLAKTTVALSQQLSRQPTDEEVAASLATPVSEVREARRAAAGYRPISLHQPLRGTNIPLAEAVGERDPGLDTTVDRLSVHDLITRLPSRERRLLALRFHGDLTQAQIADGLGLSQMHVSRLLSRTLTWLREALLAEHLPSWIPGSGPLDSDGVYARFAVRRSRGLLVISARGEIDRDCVAEFRHVLGAAARSQGVRWVRVDLSGVALLDAAGVRALHAAVLAADRCGRDLRFVNVRPVVRRVLAFSGLHARIIPAAGDARHVLRGATASRTRAAGAGTAT